MCKSRRATGSLVNLPGLPCGTCSGKLPIVSLCAACRSKGHQRHWRPIKLVHSLKLVMWPSIKRHACRQRLQRSSDTGAIGLTSALVLQIMPMRELVLAISAEASQEAALEATLERVQARWSCYLPWH